MSVNPIVDTSKILVTCAPCTSEALSAEITQLGYTVLEKSELFVSIDGTFIDCMRLNLNLRTAYRVFFLIKEMEARSFEELYFEVKKLPWEQWIPSDGYLSVDSRATREDVRDTRFPNLKVKDAIVDRIAEKCGQRPDSGPALTGCSVFLYWKGNDASLYLDTTGESLFKRGYRTHINEAPLQETLAANLILNSRWDKNSSFVNPMCGSGTLAIEAALIALKKPAGLMGRSFAFQKFSFYKNENWEFLCDEAKKESLNSLSFKIIATDIDDRAIKSAKQNAKQAGVDHLIDFYVSDFRKTSIPEENKGIVILNPEYGMRLGNQEELIEVYQAIGDFFKQHCKGYFGYVFTGNADLGKMVGLKPKRRMPFYNGLIECRLLEFELYDGSKKKVVSGQG
jgi:putative N6-adenine-specific DNA methylase